VIKVNKDSYSVDLPTLADLQREVHTLAKDKGWYDTIRSPLEIHALIISEIAEAIEEARKGTPGIYQTVPNADDTTPTQFDVTRKPEGEAIELADAIIRILDYAEYRGFDMEAAIALKHTYNKTRPHRHGGKLY
jgi:NTP pyrophosphatase (non-canonical NTP hydrolase)